MRKAFRHTGVLMMLAVVGLGLIGAAYTLWFEKLTLVTDIQTGTLNADWSFHAWTAPVGTGEGSFAGSSSNSGAGKPIVALPTVSVLNGGVASLLGLSGTGTGSSNFTHSNFPAGKPQPTCQGAITQVAGSPDTLELDMSGLYPYAGCEFVFNLESTGSVPFHMSVLSQKVQQCDASNVCTDVTGNLPWTRGLVNGGSTTNYNACLGLLTADWKWPIPGPISEVPGTLPLPSTPPASPPVQIHAGTPLVCDVMYVLDENWQTDSGYVSNQGLHFKVTTQYAAYQWNETPNSAALNAIASATP